MPSARSTRDKESLWGALQFKPSPVEETSPQDVAPPTDSSSRALFGPLLTDAGDADQGTEAGDERPDLLSLLTGHRHERIDGS